MLEGFSGLHRLWTFCVLLLVTVMVINAIQSYSAISELVDNESRAGKTKSMLRALKDVYSSMQDAELGLRGFLIAGKADLLKPYFTALDDIKKSTVALNAVVSEKAMQAERVEKLETMISARLAQMSSDINEKSENIGSERVSNKSLMDSHRSMISMRNLVSEMENTEFQLLNEQYLEARQSRSKVKSTIVISNSISLILILVIAFLVKRMLDKQRSESDWLEAMVEKRTRELKHFTDELQRSNNELQDFAFVASHDLQEPLRKIRAFGDRLSSRYAERLGDGADYIHRMQGAAQRMSNLIEDLLTFSRVSTRSNPTEKVDLGNVVKEVLENLEIAIEEHKAQISVDTLPTVEADPSQMRQLFQNIIGNALKFTVPDRSPIIAVKLIAEEADEDLTGKMTYYTIEISDNGIGFDERYLEKIFAPFQRLHGRENYEGTGIGLAICRRIVQRHQGELTARSQPGEGTTFVITMPEFQRENLEKISEELSEYEF